MTSPDSTGLPATGPRPAPTPGTAPNGSGNDHTGVDGTEVDRSGRLVGTDALRLHLTLAAGLALCIGAFIFELLRALGGHTFSWMYVFEWPLFAGFAIYMWWSLLNGHDRRRPVPAGSGPESGSGTGRSGSGAADGPLVEGAEPAGPTGPAEPGAGGTGGDDDADLRAWNRYLREMEAAEARDEGVSD